MMIKKISLDKIKMQELLNSAQISIQMKVNLFYKHFEIY